MVNFEAVKSERGLRKLIKGNLNKEYSPGTKPSIDFIFKLLEDAYNDGLKYDVTDMRNAVLAFAVNSTHQADYCIKKVNQMKFKSEEASAAVSNPEAKLVFYDIEIFPNLFLVNWKFDGKEHKVNRMINPTPKEIEELMKFRLVGFNCRRYDNHMLYARLIGYTNEQLYTLSQRIISGSRNCFFGEAYNISYTDVYDFASAGNKKSLKKLEIEMGIHHQELGLPWDQPVPEELWPKVAEYCDNDVIATEAAFYHLKADWTARCILADLAGMTVNDTTNSLTTRIIFGKNKTPQNEFNYRDLSKPVYELDPETKKFLDEACPEMMAKKHGKAQSLLPYFEGYKFEFGKSTYRGEEIGEGGKVYAEPGTYYMVALLDIMSQHPHSLISECFFGPRFTKAFREIVIGRVDIKHEAWDVVNDILDGKLGPYIEKVKRGEMTSKELANALKTAINSVYGLTAASFENPFRDPRNVDNIVAKRGALFMTDLKAEVQKRGFTVAHIKTDSIKIPNATPEIIKFVMDFGKEYGYTFEHEATYEKMCLVNGAVYIAKYADDKKCEQLYGYIPDDNKKHPNTWTATGTQFQIPYVFKTLFSKEDILFEDLCETKSVTSALYLDMNEGLPEFSDRDEKELRTLLTTKSDLETDIQESSIAPDTSAIAFFQNRLDEIEPDIQRLTEEYNKAHDYHFIGKVGQFCPIKPGCGGGLLVRETKNNKTGEIGYASATGAKGYRWMESEMVRILGKQDDIDRSYYDALVDDAVANISQYCDFEAFVADDDIPGVAPWSAESNPDDVPFDVR